MNRVLDRLAKVFLSPIVYARFRGVSVGTDCEFFTKNFGGEPYLISIGNRVQLAGNVTFWTHGSAWMMRNEDPDFDFFGKITLGNDVYVGSGACFLPGVSIGSEVIVAARSVVTKSFPDKVIIGGNPAKIIGQVDDYRIKYSVFRVPSKRLTATAKRRMIKSLPDEKFIKK